MGSVPLSAGAKPKAIDPNDLQLVFFSTRAAPHTRMQTSKSSKGVSLVVGGMIVRTKLKGGVSTQMLELDSKWRQSKHVDAVNP